VDLNKFSGDAHPHAVFVRDTSLVFFQLRSPTDFLLADAEDGSHCRLVNGSPAWVEAMKLWARRGADSVIIVSEGGPLIGALRAIDTQLAKGNGSLPSFCYLELAPQGDVVMAGAQDAFSIPGSDKSFKRGPLLIAAQKNVNWFAASGSLVTSRAAANFVMIRQCVNELQFAPTQLNIYLTSDGSIWRDGDSLTYCLAPGPKAVSCRLRSYQQANDLIDGGNKASRRVWWPRGNFENTDDYVQHLVNALSDRHRRDWALLGLCGPTP
jgi:hypothetical protein